LGRPVEPIVVDGRSDWQAFAREAERRITSEQVATVSAVGLRQAGRLSCRFSKATIICWFTRCSTRGFKTPRIGKIRADGQFDVIWTAAQPQRPVPYPKSRTTEEWKGLLHDFFSGWGDAWAAPATEPSR
jgi:hypothetical protein